MEREEECKRKGIRRKQRKKMMLEGMKVEGKETQDGGRQL